MTMLHNEVIPCPRPIKSKNSDVCSVPDLQNVVGHFSEDYTLQVVTVYAEKRYEQFISGSGKKPDLIIICCTTYQGPGRRPRCHPLGVIQNEREHRRLSS